MKKNIGKPLLVTLLGIIIFSLPVTVVAQHKIQTETTTKTNWLNYPEKKTSSFYYDDSDNKILHGKQTTTVNVNEKDLIRKENEVITYKDGVLDGPWSYTLYFKKHVEVQWDRWTRTTNDIFEEVNNSGEYKQGKPHGKWTYSSKEDVKNPFDPINKEEKFTFTCDNGKLIEFSDHNNISYTLDSNMIKEGTIRIGGKQYKIQDGVVINFFNRANGDVDQVDTEVSEIIKRYIGSDDKSFQYKTRYRFEVWNANKAYGKLDFLKLPMYVNKIEFPEGKIEFIMASRINYTPLSELKELIDYMNELPDVEYLSKYFELYHDYRKKIYYINPNDLDSVIQHITNIKNKREEEARIAEEKRKEEERKRKEEEQKRKEITDLYNSVLTENKKNESLLTNSYFDEKYKKPSYKKICNEMGLNTISHYKQWGITDIVTANEIEQFKQLLTFISDFRTYVIEDSINDSFYKKSKEIKEFSKIHCKDVGKVYSAEYKKHKELFTYSFSSYAEFQNYMKTINEVLAIQTQCLEFIEKRQNINTTQANMEADIASIKQLKKEYNSYKKSFDFSWSVDTTCFDKLRKFEQYQEDCKNNIELNKEITKNEAIILELTKDFKRIKKAYLNSKESFNLLATPNNGSNKPLEDFISFQKSVIDNIKTSREATNINLKKIKDKNKIKEILQGTK